jgi:adenosylmethionine-8-amino-7-oxononanoate aminotransferase
VADAFLDDDSVFRHLFTFGGNPASCAAGLANLKIMEDDGLVDNSAEMGDYLFERLQTLYEHTIVGDVRGGKGLICAVELVKDRETRESFPEEADVGKKIAPLMAKHGLLGRAGNVISLAPPLCITKDEVDHVVDKVDAVIGELEALL